MRALSSITALGAMAAAAAGVFGRGAGATSLVTSVRGETYPMVTSGLYAFNAQRIVAEGVGWDLFTLFAAGPALLACVPFLAHSVRARLVAGGLFAYVFYQYFMYALTWAFGPLLLPFIALAILGLVGLVMTGASVARDPPGTPARFPRRRVAALCFALASLLVVMWLGRIGSALGSGGAGLLGQTTMVVQVLDLVLVVPFAVLTGVLVLRGRPLGYALAMIFVTKAVAMAFAIAAMLLVAWRVEHVLEVVPLVIFLTAGIAALGLAVKIVRGLDVAPSVQALRGAADRARLWAPGSGS